MIHLTPHHDFQFDINKRIRINITIAIQIKVKKTDYKIKVFSTHFCMLFSILQHKHFHISIIFLNPINNKYY